MSLIEPRRVDVHVRRRRRQTADLGDCLWRRVGTLRDAVFDLAVLRLLPCPVPVIGYQLLLSAPWLLSRSQWRQMRDPCWQRDIQGRVTREGRADGVTETAYAYDATTSRLKTVTDPKLQVTTLSYNLDDTRQSITFANAVVATPSSASRTIRPTVYVIVSLVNGPATIANRPAPSTPTALRNCLPTPSWKTSDP
jgi:hypothetical protein